MTRGLVLGGGGPVGIAWEIGVAAGLADEGVHIGAADAILGTSAGAVVGALLAGGRDAALVYDAHRDRAGFMEPAPSQPSAGADLQPLMNFLMRRPPSGYPDAALLAEIGTFALTSATLDEELFKARIGLLVPDGLAWPARFRCTAVEAASGALAVWDAASDVPLTLAVASSCAVPGLYPPVTVGKGRFVDGGIRSNTNCDLGAGPDVVLAIAVTMPGLSDIMAGMAARELEPLAAAGTRTALIVPDADALQAFGGNLMDDAGRPAVMAAGRAQGRAEAERLGAVWRSGQPAP